MTFQWINFIKFFIKKIYLEKIKETSCRNYQDQDNSKYRAGNLTLRLSIMNFKGKGSLTKLFIFFNFIFNSNVQFPEFFFEGISCLSSMHHLIIQWKINRCVLISCGSLKRKLLIQKTHEISHIFSRNIVC